MNKLTEVVKFVIFTVLETFLRMFPIPAKTGLRKIGNPDHSSPVFLTCNFHLTVLRVKKALKGIDCYLLIADSKGINVWCAATGAHLNNHSVISVLKTSGIEDKVSHKTVILPQLAAPGIEAKEIRKKTQWKVLWGPVYAKDIPSFIKQKFQKTTEMKKITFTLSHRIEMAVMWAFPVSIFLICIWAPLYKMEVFAIVGQVWLISLLTFIAFPIFNKILQKENKKKKHILFTIQKLSILLLTLIFASIGVFLYVILYRNDLSLLVRWSIVSFVICLVINLELKGSTPTYKSDSHADRIFEVVIDEDKCKGADFCEEVCPRACFQMNEENKTIMLVHPERCVKCSACIVQCVFDALSFQNQEGKILLPETIRKYKLNLAGKRTVEK